MGPSLPHRSMFAPTLSSIASGSTQASYAAPQGSLASTRPDSPAGGEHQSQSQLTDYDDGLDLEELPGWMDDSQMTLVDALDTPQAHMAISSLPSSIDIRHIKQQSKISRKRTLAALCREWEVSPLDLATDILNDEASYGSSYSDYWFRPKSEGIHRFLDALTTDKDNKKGQCPRWTKLSDWLLRSHAAVDVIKGVVDDEMEKAKKHLMFKRVQDITPEFLENWNFETIYQPLLDSTPVLSEILIVPIIEAQLCHQRSDHATGAASMWTLWLWASNATKKVTEVLSACGLCMGNTSTTALLESLADKNVDLAAQAARGPHLIGYDNFNASTTDVEQRGITTPYTTISATTGYVYELRSGNGPVDPSHVEWTGALRDGFDRAPGLRIEDVALPEDRHQFLRQDLVATVVDSLFKLYGDLFSAHIKESPILSHPSIRPFPKGYKTKFYCTRASRIEEGSRKGNLLYQNHLYTQQFDMTTAMLLKNAILFMGDQHTNKQTRGGKMIRLLDINDWERRKVFQIAIALFHLQLNLVWVISHKHKGTLSSEGSLLWFYELLEKTKLTKQHPDYHTLLMALRQTLDALLVAAWDVVLRDEGFSGGTQDEDIYRQFASSEDLTAEKILELAQKIQARWASVPLDEDQEDDIISTNIHLLIRDLLYAITLIRAVSDGDYGRVEDLFPHLELIFRGAGSHNYASEILFLMHNFKYVWTPEFSNIVRDNSIICPSGLGPGHCFGVDLNAEHGVDDIKDICLSRGMNGNWERIGHGAACIKQAAASKLKVPEILGIYPQSRSHTTPETRHITVTALRKVLDKQLLVYVPGRGLSSKTVKPMTDLMAVGRSKLESQALADFNKRLQQLQNGLEVDDEVDDIPPSQIVLAVSDE
ncbi:hypothetical protein CONPUDRAFT_159245 [Coniophora puteana RWD-64-598 SS2]|uniref:DUF6589 domain-containing protein n=1 Tax=Coniophora puteana (strain RWD-64-598) TaxID=741705 RepID=A0A5M3M789_CONPW|nr:uncharacterized protein CONPUDRAFT_159245 [Coniophora puteana RWD-64-598 SS2]EIW75109.1 hypothetical protein CONPUDRAFT_159245 [Coniophora puteana RWD-64-598 SS2]